MTYVLGGAQPARSRVVLSSPVNLHPDLVRRLVALGLLEVATGVVARELRFPPARGRRCRPSAATAVRVCVNYAALGLVTALLDRIAEQDSASAPPPRPRRRRPVDLNRLTQKSQEALHDAQTKALRYGHPDVKLPSICCSRCSNSLRAWCPGSSSSVRVDADPPRPPPICRRSGGRG